MFGKVRKIVLPFIAMASLAGLLTGCIIAPAPGYYRPYHPYYAAPHYYYYP